MARTILVAALLVMLALTTWPSAESQPAGDSIGVLIGLRNSIDNSFQDKSSPEIYRLRTLWVQGALTGKSAAPIELPNLLVPRRSGFWRVGLSGGCREEDFLDVDDKPAGSMAELSAFIVAGPAGIQRPEFKRGLCKRSDVRCVTERVATIVWVWPEYITVMDGGESSCGAHPDGSWDNSVRDLTNLKGLSVRDALGPSAQTQFLRAFEKARQEDQREWGDKCGDQEVKFDPDAWLIKRENGKWRVDGWTVTHRLCGVGFDYAIEPDLSRITGRRSDDASRWQALKARWPELDDVHTSPGGGWTVIAADEELMIFSGRSLDRELLRVKKARFEELVMVEWATGRNVSRWNDEVVGLSKTE